MEIETVYAFIIRPFGIKKGINFDNVEKKLIDPALTALKIAGRTTGDSLKQGNIRTEMFQRLLTADIVIVDISIGNANVFYELGIRHALRNKRTFMIRCEGVELPPDEVPFDLKTDRYLSYNVANPETSLEDLTKGLRQTLLSDDSDSPVFQLLPFLIEQDKSRFLAVPGDFSEEVECARKQKLPRNQWGDLKLLQTEVSGFPWAIEGLRVVGHAQFSRKAYEYARDTWDAVRKNDPNHKEANILLGTIYQRLDKRAESNNALQRVLKDKSATQFERAEAHSLIGSNLKEEWKEQWENKPAEQRKEAALRSSFLKDSYNQYKMGFIADLNHYYSGINALGMLAVITEMATALPDVWNASFDNDDDGERELKKLKNELENLRGSVTLSLEAAKIRAERTGQMDIWFRITLADLACLSPRRPSYVADQYTHALAGAEAFEIDTARRQLLLYEQLEVMNDKVAAALKAIPVPDTQEEQNEKPPHVLLFAGHRIDSLTRKEPRFPGSEENISKAKLAIKEAIKKEVEHVNGEIIGIAGGASGGDILFHEVCAELNISTTLYLVMPRDEYVKTSVQEAGHKWMDRFNSLYNRLPRRELSEAEDLPRWLQSRPKYTIWNRNNLWTLYNAMALGSQYVTLMVLWDGKSGDGPGGTQDMVTRAEGRGAKTIILNTKEIFDL
ncbi:MAG TPA: tetratricopeptide repeat-containing protein [Blastocatellia bacterium]|nr:tetratricopeptide repeat-containing protein [Blastocatellia bacterium]